MLFLSGSPGQRSNGQPPYSKYVPIEGGNLWQPFSIPSLPTKVLNTNSPLQIIHNKMVIPNDSIEPYWRKKKQCIMQHVYQRTYGTLLLTLWFMSTTELQCDVFNGKLQLNLYSRRIQTSLIFESLVVLLTFTSQRINIKINSHQKLKR